MKTSRRTVCMILAAGLVVVGFVLVLSALEKRRARLEPGELRLTHMSLAQYRDYTRHHYRVVTDYHDPKLRPMSAVHVQYAGDKKHLTGYLQVWQAGRLVSEKRELSRDRNVFPSDVFLVLTEPSRRDEDGPTRWEVVVLCEKYAINGDTGHSGGGGFGGAVEIPQGISGDLRKVVPSEASTSCVGDETPLCAFVLDDGSPASPGGQRLEEYVRNVPWGILVWLVLDE